MFGAIGTFTAYPILKDLLKKVDKKTNEYLDSIVYGQNIYQYTEKLHEDHPDATNLLSRGHKYDVTSNAFDRLEFVFFDEQPNDRHNYIQFLGVQNNNRVYKWVRKEYIATHSSLNKYKVFIAKANGSGTYGERLSSPLIGEPLTGSTQTFLTVGSFDTHAQATAVYKYICSKFTRALLGVLKITQDNTAGKWRYVPLQDFTSASDIDWTLSIPEIDQQLYAKYKLSKAEIEFIESHVKEMG